MAYSIYLINLDRSKERLVFSERQLQSEALNFIRISATDGTQITNEERKLYLKPNFSEYHKTISNFELACYLSHRRCWQTLLGSRNEFALILEDDFVISQSLRKALDTINQFTFDWDCIKLTEAPIKRKALISESINNHELIVYNKVPCRTGAYVISRSGAEKMLAQSEKIGRPIDIQFQYWWESNLIVYGLKPYPINIRVNLDSTIDNINNQRKKANASTFVKLKQHSLFTLKNYIKTRKRLKSF